MLLHWGFKFVINVVNMCKNKHKNNDWFDLLYRRLCQTLLLILVPLICINYDFHLGMLRCFVIILVPNPTKLKHYPSQPPNYSYPTCPPSLPSPPSNYPYPYLPAHPNYPTPPSNYPYPYPTCPPSLPSPPSNYPYPSPPCPPSLPSPLSNCLYPYLTCPPSLPNPTI